MQKEIDNVICTHNAVKDGDAESYGRFSTTLSELSDVVDRNIYTLTGDRAREIIKKLRAGELPGDEDVKLIKLYIVGDAESFLDAEEDLFRWMKENDEVVDRLKGAGDDLTVDQLFKLRGDLKEALNNSRDILDYLEQKSRLARFNKSASNWEPSSLELLANIMAERLTSAGLLIDK